MLDISTCTLSWQGETILCCCFLLSTASFLGLSLILYIVLEPHAMSTKCKLFFITIHEHTAPNNQHMHGMCSIVGTHVLLCGCLFDLCCIHLQIRCLLFSGHQCSTLSSSQTQLRFLKTILCIRPQKCELIFHQ